MPKKQKTSPTPKSEASVILLGSDSLPSMIDMAEGRAQVQLGTVVARAYEQSGLSVEEWNALPAAERDAALVAVIDAMRADPRTGDDEANEQGSQAPDTGHADSQDLDVAGAAAPGGECPTGAVDQDEKEPDGGWCYPILTPSTFRNVLVKEGFIQLTRAEAAPYITAGVLADDPCYPPGQEPAE